MAQEYYNEPFISANIATYRLDRPFVLTQDKKLVLGRPYLYGEGRHSAAVRLVNAWVEDRIIYLTLQELQSERSLTVSWNLDYDGSYFMWTLADFETLSNLPE